VRLTQPTAERSAIMRAVRSRDTAPELKVRRLAHGLGFRFRLGGRGLPGSPDLAFARLSACIFVHGCFWHGHGCARGARVPQANRAYWLAKIARNRARDEASLQALRRLGWRALVVWECETRDEAALARRLRRFLSRPASSAPCAGRAGRRRPRPRS
jgi:DNA mismatch endonuclease, patch repair protein